MLVELFEEDSQVVQKVSNKPLIRRTIVFIILVQLYGELTADVYLKLLKPIPIFLLFFLISRKEKQSKLVFYGLLASLIGDLALMIRNDIVFQIGAGSFLVAHILYSSAFCLDIDFSEILNLSKWRVSRLFLLCNAVTVIYILNLNALWDKTSNLFLFIIYGMMLTLMMVCALMRAGSVKGKMYWYVSIGALLFGLSDHLLAFLKFNHYHTDIGETMIMVCYYLAQYLIVTGIQRKHMVK